MGTGDWNDGMNRVGADGKGESVWLGWFLMSVLRDWSAIAEARGDANRVEAWRRHAGELRRSDRARSVGMESGIVAHGSTTARPLVRRPMTSVASMPSRNRGA